MEITYQQKATNSDPVAQDYITQLLQASAPQPSSPQNFDPTAAQNKAKLAIGLALMQPYSPQQSLAGHLGQAIAGGQTVMDKEAAANKADQMAQQKLDIARGGLAVDAAKMKAQEEYWKGALANERAKTALTTKQDLEKGVNELAKLYAGTDAMGNPKPVTYELYQLARFNKTGKIALDDPTATLAIREMMTTGIQQPDGSYKTLSKKQAQQAYIQGMREQLRRTAQQVKTQQTTQVAPSSYNPNVMPNIPTDPAQITAMIEQRNQALHQQREEHQRRIDAEKKLNSIITRKSNPAYPMGDAPFTVEELTQRMLGLQQYIANLSKPQDADLKAKAAQDLYHVQAQLAQLQRQQSMGQ